MDLITQAVGKKPRQCYRCGRTDQIERHHIKHRADGGTDEESNLRDLCLPCHDYQHSLENIEFHIKLNEKKHQDERKQIWLYRLKVLNCLNAPEIIKLRGTFVSYWEDVKTHYMSREVRNVASITLPNLQAVMSLDTPKSAPEQGELM